MKILCKFGLHKFGGPVFSESLNHRCSNLNFRFFFGEDTCRNCKKKRKVFAIHFWDNEEDNLNKIKHLILD